MSEISTNFKNNEYGMHFTADLCCVFSKFEKSHSLCGIL